MRPNADDLLALSIAELAPLLRSRQVSSVELTQAVLSRIEHLQPVLNSFITVTAPEAEPAAEAADRAIAAGKYLGPLHGIPISIKDLFATKGVRTTAGSKILANWIPDADAVAVAKLRAAGAVIVGKTNMHEFAYGITNENAYYGPARNPWNPHLVPGGSSGGSAAAVATSQGFASLGSDTGGSIRIPSAACGIVGLKPTYGLVSRVGAIPLSWSLDHVGPITRTVEDAAIMLSILADFSAGSPAAPHPGAGGEPRANYRADLRKGIEGIRVGISKTYFFENADPEILSAVSTAIAKLETLGATTVPVSIPQLEHCAAAETQINLAEATSYHAPNLLERPDDYSPGVRTTLEAGRYLLATDYVQSQRVRATLQKNFAAAFDQVDVIVMPTLPAFPPELGQMMVQSGSLHEFIVDAFLRFNIPFDLTGLPAISLPCGFGSNGLPIGLQIAAPAFHELRVLQVAHAYEQSSEWRKRRPAIIQS